jgi:hypothetical protein
MPIRGSNGPAGCDRSRARPVAPGYTSRVALHAFASMLMQIARRWRPEIGDPSLLGWLTVAAYLVAFAMCWRSHDVARARPNGARPARAWAALASCMLLLGVNKQLDLQSLFTQVGRAAAFAGGWYAQRHAVQIWFIATLALGGAVAGLTALLLLRDHAEELWLAAVGTGLLAGYVLTRAAFFNHIDWDGHAGGAVAPFHFLLELGGITCVALNARRYARR